MARGCLALQSLVAGRDRRSGLSFQTRPSTVVPTVLRRAVETRRAISLQASEQTPWSQAGGEACLARGGYRNTATGYVRASARSSLVRAGRAGIGNSHRQAASISHTMADFPLRKRRRGGDKSTRQLDFGGLPVLLQHVHSRKL